MDDAATLSARQAALRAGLDERDLRRRILRGELAAEKDGRNWRIRIADLEAAGFNLKDEAADAAERARLQARAETAERELAELRAARAALERELAELRHTVALLHARPAQPAPPPARRGGRFSLRRREPEHDWRVVAGMVDTDRE